jgi:phospholipase/carboxylesterase
MSAPLIVLLHGVGSSGAAMTPLAAAVEARIADAVVVAPDAPHAFDMGPNGRQWFSIRGVTDSNRPERIAEALTALAAMLEQLCHQHRADRRKLVLIGFSQGAMMALASLASGGLEAGAVVAIAGRLASPVVEARHRSPPLLLLHGTADRVVPAEASIDAAVRLMGAGYRVRARLTRDHDHRVATQQAANAADWIANTLQAPVAGMALS